MGAKVGKAQSQSQRRTQRSENACEADLAGGGLMATLDTGLMYFYPSFVERCMESLPMDVNNTLSHIANLNGIFEQFQ